jgi:hypothetical protein
MATKTLKILLKSKLSKNLIRKISGLWVLVYWLNLTEDHIFNVHLKLTNKILFEGEVTWG